MQNKINIKIFILDELRERIDFNSIKKQTKEIFEIDSNFEYIDTKYQLSMQKENSDDDISQIIDNSKVDTHKYDFTVYVTNYPIQDNYYMRRCDKKLFLSTYFLDLEECFFQSGIEQSNFIIKCLYEAGLMWLFFDKKTMSMSEYVSMCHDDIGCLFDFNMEKKNVYNNMFKPILCSDCKKKLLEKIDKKIISEFEERLRAIKKPFFFVVKDWCLYNPTKAFIGASIIAGFMASIGSKIFDWIVSILDSLLGICKF